MNTRKRLFLLAVCASISLLVSSCGRQVQTAGPADIAKSEVLVLRKASGKGHVHAIRIAGSGSIDGKAEVQLMLNGSVYKKEEVSGKFAFEWRGDWYADEAEIRYQPSGVSRGELLLRYRFES